MITNKTEEIELSVTQKKERDGKSPSGAGADNFRREDLRVNSVTAPGLMNGKEDNKPSLADSADNSRQEDLGVEEPGQMVDGERVSFADLKKKWKAIDKALSADNFFANMPFILFIAGLMVIYIFNTHRMETTTREIDRLKNEMKEYRWKYISAKSDLMFNSKQTEVASAVDSMHTGLKELTTPPKKIVVKKSEY